MIMLKDVINPGKYIIKHVYNDNPKFSGLGIIPGNTINITHIGKHLIQFRIGLTDMFARKGDIDIAMVTVV